MTLQPGKLPQAMLADLLGRVTHLDARVLVGPGIGRDAAVIDLGDRLLVAKTDPVTFATEHVGWYAVHVNANDIACMGARPAWFLATALLPPGAPESLPGEVFDQILSACADLGIELVGGHTEVTPGVDRPVVAGAMLGEATRDEIVTGEGIVPGDAVLITKGIAIEGTALLAHEAAETLEECGVDAASIERARRLLFEPGISVVRDARALAPVRPRLMHDPTEGGVATALHEMAQAAGTTLRIDPDRLHVFPETQAICGALGLDPLGLLASGALLAIVPAAAATAALTAWRDAGIEGVAIGRIESGPPGVIIGANEPGEPLPAFARDELARFFDQQATADP